MNELERQVVEFCEDKTNKDYYYKGVLYEVFYEYQYMYENYEDYKDIIPKELLNFEKIKDITDEITNNEYITSIIHECMYDNI